MKYTLNFWLFSLLVLCLFSFKQASSSSESLKDTEVAVVNGFTPSLAEAAFSSFPCTPNDAVKVVVIGSSTAEGHGVKTKDSWVGRYAKYLEDINPANEVINLAKGGYNTYYLLPTGTSTPVVFKPDPERNITKALSYNPDAIIINLPSNDTWEGYGKGVQMANFKIMYDKAQEKGVPVWITTTQPRDQKLDDEKLQIQLAVRDAIEETYGAYALDFWTGIATSEGGIKPEYYLPEETVGKNIHVNEAGHKVLFEVVVDAKVYETTRDLKYHLFTSVKSGAFSDKATWNLKMVPGNDATVIVQGNHTVSLSKDESVKAARVENKGTLDLNNYQLSVDCTLEALGAVEAGQAVLELTGTENVTLGGFTTIKKLIVNKSKGTVNLGNNLTVTSTLDLTDGAVALGGYDLTLEKSAAVKGGSAASYVQTTGQGDLIFKVDESIVNQALVFPVGDSKNYTPFTFILKSADMTNGKLSMRVGAGEPAQAGSANPILARYWDLRQEGLSNYLYNVRYQYMDSDVKSVSGKGEKDLKVIKYSDKEGWLIGGQVDVNNNILFAEGINSFSTFSGGNSIEGASPLPVTFIKFYVEPTEEGYAGLHWATASERNNDYFAVERSGNAEQWASVAKVKGGGNSAHGLTYSFTDRSALSGKSFYRLKQVDFDGQFEYSPIITFYSDQPLAFDVMVRPNPVGSRESWSFQLTTPEPGVSTIVEVSDIMGRIHLLEEVMPKEERTDFSIQNVLRPGLYLLTVRQGYQVVQKKLLVK